MQMNTRFGRYTDHATTSVGDTIRIGRDTYKIHSGGMCLIEPQKVKRIPTIVRNIGQKAGRGVDRTLATGFRANPEGDGWYTRNGKRFMLMSPSRGKGSPYDVIFDPAFHQCEPVPDQYYSDLLLSDGAYFWLQMFQLERHLGWMLRTKFRINKEARENMVKQGVGAFIGKIKRERGVDLNGPLSLMYSEADELLLEHDERVQDFIRRYGRDNRKIRN